MIKQIMLPIGKLENNTGQIKGVPKNPTTIRDAKQKALEKSMKEFPLLLDLRELIVFQQGKKFIVLAGNRRLNGGRNLKLKEMPCKVLPANTSIKELKRTVIVDNVRYGDLDEEALEKDWGKEALEWADIDSTFTPEGDGVQVTFKPSTSIKLKYSSVNQCKKVKEALAEKHEDPGTAVMILLGLKGGKK